MLTVHMIGNAHLDPVWLWRLPSGVAEALATCRTACDLLDENPRFVFTRSDAWVYETVQELDPALFARIAAHVATGRWAVVGGWYVQPDCNLPRAESFARHIEIGGRNAIEQLGVRVTVGYNVDSFGHAGSLPGILAAHGYDAYVMMRPMRHEKTLPADLFRWRANPDANLPGEVMTWRIPGAYCNAARDLAEHVKLAMASAVPGVDHVMCFYGVGDHGGSPTREQIRWIEGNANAFDGARLVFSHPRAFFDAVKPHREALPVVEGELQMHSIGCYSVVRTIKTGVRRAEHGLHMAERAVAALPSDAPADAAARLARGWRATLFNQFHDIYGGTSIPEACDDAAAQLDGAARDAEDIAYATLFRRAARLPAAPQQRVVVFNASDTRFDGAIHHEPWIVGNRFEGWLADESDAPIPLQIVPSRSQAGLWGSLLWQATLAPGELRCFTIHGEPGAEPADTDIACDESSISNDAWTVGPAANGGLFALRPRGSRVGVGREGLTVVVIDDPSDTWSHGIDRFAGAQRGAFMAEPPVVEETGPVRASLRVRARWGASVLVVWARLYRGDPRLEIEARLDWHETLAVAKLTLPLDREIASRLDGISGGSHVRPQDGREHPLIDGTVARLRDGSTLGVASPDCAALDGEGARLRFTLVRSPAHSWHDPAPLSPSRARFTDQGEHVFRFTLLPDADAAMVERTALAFHRPPLCIDWTRGM